VKGRRQTAPLRAARGRALAVVLFAWIVVGAAANADPPRLLHSPASGAAAWQPVGIEARLAGDVAHEAIATLDVVVVAPDGGLHSVPLALSRDAAFGEIPGALVAPPALSYYLRLVDTDGTVVTLPPGAPEGGVFRIAVAEERDQSAAEAAAPIWAAGSVEILSPAPGEVIEEGGPVIAGLIDPPLEEPWEALVVLDGSDVTSAAEVAPGFFVLSIADSLAKGPHRITFSAVGAAGPVEASWVFFVGEKTAVPGDWLAAERLAVSPEPADAWQVVGRLEVGWAAVVAETTAVESLDVFLPYDEVSRPILDLYASGTAGSRSFLIMAQYNPVYDDDLDWSASLRTRRFDAEAGSIFPSLSRATLDWAAGLGARAAARLGWSTTDVVAIRMSEADTLAGFGIYSRFAIGAKETVEWKEGVSASVVYVSVFDREDSVPEEQRLTDPLRNEVVSGLVSARRGRIDGELELARSSAVGEIEGSGTAFRARVAFERDLDNRVSLEYGSSEPEYYSAGSFEFEPGESAVQIEYAYRPSENLKTSGWARVGRTTGSEFTVAEDEAELKTYARADLSWRLMRGDARAYVVGRYDRTPYQSYDYEYTYAALGGTWRGARTRALGSVSWSRSESPEATDTWAVAADLRHEIIAGRWTARAAGRWTVGSGDETDYARSHYTLESRWTLGEIDLTAEYWRIERDDRVDAVQTYTEHVAVLSAGRAF
jgi:hypothetical protein